ncbi:MAG: hypothetical protein NC543_08875 [bacterium]|nr:hypothetical protein [bacterium]MCM1375556.1 hypothetical protein [Muribaculum sp.]
MKKRLAALALAATMVIGSGLTVCASSASISDMAGAAAGQEITGDASMNLPTISVTVPTTANIVINPFQMEYEDGDGNKNSNQIICVPQDIVNDSNVAIAVNVAELTAKNVSDGILISTTALTDKTTTKSAFLYVEVKEDGKDFAAKYDAKSTNQVVVPYVKDGDTKTKKGAKDAVVVLGAKPADGDGTKAQFTINGAVVANPTQVNTDKTVSPAPWLASDTLTVSFKFTFTPQIVTKTATP